jgi:hypothetical protein
MVCHRGWHKKLKVQLEEIMAVILSDAEKARFDNVRTKSKEMGVLDINFSTKKSSGSLECYERTLEIIEKNKKRYDQNASKG